MIINNNKFMWKLINKWFNQIIKSLILPTVLLPTIWSFIMLIKIPQSNLVANKYQLNRRLDWVHLQFLNTIKLMPRLHTLRLILHCNTLINIYTMSSNWLCAIDEV